MKNFCEPGKKGKKRVAEGFFHIFDSKSDVIGFALRGLIFKDFAQIAEIIKDHVFPDPFDNVSTTVFLCHSLSAVMLIFFLTIIALVPRCGDTYAE